MRRHYYEQGETQDDYAFPTVKDNEIWYLRSTGTAFAPSYEDRVKYDYDYTQGTNTRTGNSYADRTNEANPGRYGIWVYRYPIYKTEGSVFSGLATLQSIVLPVGTIGERINSELSNIHVLGSIGNGVFSSCPLLERVFIKNIGEFGYQNFINSPKLQHVIIDNSTSDSVRNRCQIKGSTFNEFKGVLWVNDELYDVMVDQIQNTSNNKDFTVRKISSNKSILRFPY